MTRKNEAMQYKTELHAHTSDVSRCAKMAPEDVAERYIAAGYTTVVVTNHYAEYIFDGKGSWEECINAYLSGVRRMREQAKGRLNILSGAEVRNYYSKNDYLLYGADEDFLRKHQNLHRIDVKDLSKLARENGVLLVQAHPFRNNMTVTDPKFLDGIEVFNGSPHTESRNNVADAWAKSNGLLRTSGSDFHGGCFIKVDGKRVWHPCSDDIYGNHHTISGGILTNQPITSQEQLKSILRDGSYSLICEGPAAERYGMKTMSAKY